LTSAPDAIPVVRRPRLLGGARVRILAGMLLLLVASEGIALFAQREILRARAGERVDDALVQEVEEFRTLARLGRNPNSGERFGGDVAAMFDVFLTRNVPGEGEAVFTFLGTEPYRSTVGDPRSRALQGELERVAGVRAPERGEAEIEAGRVRYLAVPVEVGGRRLGTFAVTVDLGQEEDEIAEATQVGAGVSLAVLLLAAGVGWVVAGRVLSPLRGLTETARSITESDLTRRIDVEGNDEIAELARTFNAMLDRLEAAFESQRAFVSDAGHELRTPITIVRGHLELLGEDPDERRETIELVTDELDRMSRFVDDLLTLAKAERADFLQLQDLDLDVLTEELVAKAAALGDRDWRLDGVGTGRVSADRQRLTQAVMSLAQNAVQHTGPGDTIALGSALRGTRARLWVRDSGPGVTPADRERIFDRFARAGRRRSEGAGLGLAIVRAIAEAHGGRVDVHSRVGEGATFTIEIPAEPRTAVTQPPQEVGTA
jgi:signal transduction histidine kinase